MKELNGHIYSREEFKEYKFRSIFKLSVDDDWRNDTNITVYTDNTDKDKVFKIVNSLTSRKVISCTMEYWVSKEQEELTAKFIEEDLQDLYYG